MRHAAIRGGGTASRGDTRAAIAACTQSTALPMSQAQGALSVQTSQMPACICPKPTSTRLGAHRETNKRKKAPACVCSQPVP